MAKQSATDFPSGDVVFLDRGNGTSALVHLHGATLLSWKCQGQETLFLSEKAVFNNKKAIRGGIPIIFPNFGPWGSGPQHGFARIKRWKVELPKRKDNSGNVIAAFTLEDDEETRSMWDFRFRLVYTLELLENTLHMNISLHNVDIKGYDFTFLLHSYFRTPDISQTAIIGLDNLKFVDKLKDDTEVTECRKEVTVDQNYDRIYMDTPSELVVGKIGDGHHSIIMQTFDFPDVVVWNPWSEKAQAMADFGDSEYLNMVCVEAGCVSRRVELDAGQQFECSQRFTYVPAAK